MYSTPTVNAFNTLNSDPVGHLIPYVAASPILATNPLNVNAPFLATSSTLEYFGNMPVVNGVVYGKETAEQRVVRMRFIGGTDSRTWVMRLKIKDANPLAPARYLPFWQIASEQGLLAKPVMRESMVLMPGERLDVLVDFKATATILNDSGVVVAGSGPLAGGQVIMENWGADAPYDGSVIPTVAATLLDPVLAAGHAALLIPEIMAFNVVAINSTLTPPATVADVPTPTAAWAAATTLNTIPSMLLNPNQNPDPRKVSLVEIKDLWGRTMPTIDARGFMEIPQTEMIARNQTQVWEIVNTTVDAHPMHLHQVAFQTLGRYIINTVPVTTATGVPTVDPLTGLNVTALDVVYAQTVPPYDSISYVVNPLSPALIAPDPSEAGWKDTIMCPPGQVTRVIAKFDIVGQYVWHCHILSHEEHDMMRPMKIAPVINTPTITASSPATTVGAAVTFTSSIATTTTGVITTPLAGASYVFEYMKVTLPAGTTWTELVPSTSNIAVITFPTAGTYNVRVKVNDPLQNFATSLYSNQTGLAITINPTFTITVTQGLNGTITPAGTLGVVTVASGGTQAFTITPIGALAITNVLVDGVSVGAGATYTFTNVLANHTITATFGVSAAAPATAILSSVQPSPQLAGTTVQFTAGATGGSGTYEYEFNVRNTVGVWSVGRVYSTIATWSWNTTGLTPGTYAITVFVRNAGTTAPSRVYKTMYFAVLAPTIPPVATATLSSVQPSPQLVGTTVQFTAGATGGSGTYEYEFNVRNTVGVWSVGRVYSTIATWNWITAGLTPGNYAITVFARNAGSTAPGRVYKTVYFAIR